MCPSERNQFGKPIGSFQAVKHHMANVAVRLEYAKAPVYRAAYAAANKLSTLAENVSHAKLVACEAANLAANAGGFQRDAIDYGLAISKNDRPAAEKIRVRFDKRLTEVHRLVLAALNIDLRTSEDPRATAINKALDRARKRLP